MEIEELVSIYKEKGPKDECMTELCENIIDFYNKNGYLSDKQKRILEIQIRDNEEIEHLISIYEEKKTNNDYTKLCDSIIQFYREKGYLSDKQLYVLRKQTGYFDEINQILNDIYNDRLDEEKKFDIYGKLKDPKGFIKIDFNQIPNNCTECPMIVNYYDEDAMWGSGYSWECIFGCSIFGAAVKRPDDCPIVVIKKEDTD